MCAMSHGPVMMRLRFCSLHCKRGNATITSNCRLPKTAFPNGGNRSPAPNDNAIVILIGYLPICAGDRAKGVAVNVANAHDDANDFNVDASSTVAKSKGFRVVVP